MKICLTYRIILLVKSAKRRSSKYLDQVSLRGEFHYAGMWFRSSPRKPGKDCIACRFSRQGQLGKHSWSRNASSGIEFDFPRVSKKAKCLLENLHNAKDQNTPFQTRGPKRAVETPERQGTQLGTFRFERAGKGTRVRLWISYMHIVQGPEKALGSNYGFPICILCEGLKRHQGLIMDFLYTYCARAGNGTRVQLWIFCMHIMREPEKAPGSIYGFSICILCESH
jgi:hypothetical protein